MSRTRAVVFFSVVSLCGCSGPPVESDMGVSVDSGGDAANDVGVDMSEQVEPLVLEPDPLRIGVGFALELSATVGGGRVEAAWSTSSENVEISEGGRLVALAAGDFTVSAKAGSRTATLDGEALAPPWKQVDASTFRTCAVSGAGTLHCFGVVDWAGLHSELAIGSSKPTAVDTPGPVREVAVASWATCILGESGDVHCRGLADEGVLGSVLAESSRDWVEVDLPGTYTQLVAGSGHFCALRERGDVWCWGQAAAGAWGSVSARVIDSGMRFRHIASGDWHACGITRDDEEHCWGGNLTYQLGDHSNEYQSSPKPLYDDVSFDMMAAGRFFTCGVDDGAVACWGSNDRLTLGTETSNDFSLAPQINSVTNVRQMDAEYYTACAVKWNGDRVCWGANDHANVGNDELAEASLPSVDSTRDWWQVAVGTNHACGITSDGELLCWGADIAGSTGGGRELTMEPQVVGDGYDSVSAGRQHTCAVTDAGELECWGWNGQAQLGIGNTVWTPWPTKIPEPYVWSEVAAGSGTSCGIAGSTVYCWGMSRLGALGTAGRDYAPLPAEVTAGTLTRLRGGFEHYFVEVGGSWFNWGRNSESQLFSGGRPAQESPREIAYFDRDGLADAAVDVSAGYRHSCALLENGDAVCSGAAGDFRKGGFELSSRITTPGPWSDVSAGLRHSCFLDAAGVAECYGVLDQDQEATADPQRFGTGFDDLTSKGPYTCGTTPGGAVSCWGANHWGNAGPAPSEYESAPVEVSLGGAAASIATGVRHACAVLLDGTLTCWGDNSFGQIGVGADFFVRSPRAVVVPGD